MSTKFSVEIYEGCGTRLFDPKYSLYGAADTVDTHNIQIFNRLRDKDANKYEEEDAHVIQSIPIRRQREIVNDLKNKALDLNHQLDAKPPKATCTTELKVVEYRDAFAMNEFLMEKVKTMENDLNKLQVYINQHPIECSTNNEVSLYNEVTQFHNLVKLIEPGAVKELIERLEYAMEEIKNTALPSSNTYFIYGKDNQHIVTLQSELNKFQHIVPAINRSIIRMESLLPFHMACISTEAKLSHYANITNDNKMLSIELTEKINNLKSLLTSNSISIDKSFKEIEDMLARP